jgi:chromosomal replication initiator protein
MTPYIFAGIEPNLQIKFRRSLYMTDELMMQNIVNTVFNYFDINCDLASAMIKTNEIAQPRKIAMYFIRKKTKLSTKEIGRFFKRDHSTVIYATQSIDGYIDIDPKFKVDMDEIESFL